MSNIKFNIKRDHTVLDNRFIDDYMADVPSWVYSLVYIYALRCGSEGISVDNSHIAKKLGILESDVIKAWKYWKDKGLVKLSGNKDEPVVEFLNIENEPKQTQEKSIPLKIADTKSGYSPRDIAEILENDKAARELLAISEKLMARPLTPKESEILMEMYDLMGLPMDVIIVLVTYCSNNNKPIRYMEKTAMDWAERGIATSEAAADYLSIFTSYGKILRFYGITDRAPTSNDKKYMDKWILDYKMPIDVIEIACNKTIENTGKAALSYTDKIIENWHKNNINTVTAVKKADSEFTAKAEPPGNGAARRNNSFTDYDQKIYSDEEIKDILARKKANKHE